MRAVLPNLVVIGAMKCATTALHRYLDAHPEISMSRSKETNFFTGPEVAPHTDPRTWWRTGQWHRGLEWYSSLFDPTAPVRGETSPGYTSPDHPEAPGRIAHVIPEARLVYLIRDPVERAVSQYEHHVRDGDEHRGLEEAVLDPDSQYLSRGRYYQRLVPYLERFDRSQLLVVVQERLLADRAGELARVYRHAGADPDWWSDELARRWHVSETRPSPAQGLRKAVLDAVEDDLEVLRSFLGDALPEWGIRFEEATVGHR